MLFWKYIQNVFSRNPVVYQTDIPSFDRPCKQISEILEAVKRINWKQLQHAYGSARDVPGQLKALTSKRRGKRSRAIDALWGNIWHQGSIYQASAYTVPFLVQLAGHPDVEDREQILQLLFNLANGHSYLDVHQHLSHVGQLLKSKPDFEENKTCELKWVDRAHQAVTDDWSIYLSLLEDPNPRVRQMALYVLICCRQQAADITGPLLKYLERQIDSAMRACLLYTLSVIDPQGQQALLHNEMVNGDPLVRLVAAIGMAYYGPDPLSTEVTETLLYFLEHPEEADTYEDLPFADDLLGDIGTALCRAENPPDEQIARRLFTEMKAHQFIPFSIIPPLLHFCFHKPKEHWDQNSLTPLQREVVLAIARQAWSKDKSGHWSIYANYCDYLRTYGLEEIGQSMAGYQNKKNQEHK